MVVLLSASSPREETEASVSLKSDHAFTFDLIESRKWNDLMERLQSHPSDAAIVASEGVSSAQGNYALHEVCKNQPPIKVIERLLEANPDAIKAKGRWGYTPLHYACSSGASPEVVARLIKAYPTSTRTRDESNEFLPIHLAAKWGAAEDVIISILTTYPEGCFLKDSVGKTPMDHAKSLQMPVRASVVRALELGPMLCAVSKSALERLEHENECRIKGMSDAHIEHVADLKKQHDEELAKSAETEERLHKELMLVKSALKPVADKLRLCEKRVVAITDEKDDMIQKLEMQLQKLQQRFDAQGTELNEQLEAAKVKIDILEDQLEAKSSKTDALAELVIELTAKLDVHKRSEESLATKAVLLERARLDAERDLKDAVNEIEKVRDMGNEINKGLQEAIRKNQTYAERMEKIQKWSSMFAYSMQTWSIDNDWVHRYSGEEKTLDTIADVHVDAEKSLSATDTDESSMESNQQRHHHQDDDALDGNFPTHV
jgi:hypothetical protein